MIKTPRLRLQTIYANKPIIISSKLHKLNLEIELYILRILIVLDFNTKILILVKIIEKIQILGNLFHRQLLLVMVHKIIIKHTIIPVQKLCYLKRSLFLRKKI
jgi:hypothetical protein